MKKLLFLATLALVLTLPISALATPTTLKDILNYTGMDAYKDTGAEYVRFTDTDGYSDDATAFLLLEDAGFKNENTFGIYSFTTNAIGVTTVLDTLEVFNGPASVGLFSSVTLAFDIAAGIVTNQATGDFASIGTTFGFYIHTPQNHTFYSHTALNPDEVDHFLLFDTSDNKNGLGGSDVIVAIEDLFGGGDWDYNDMVAGISDVSPAPVPEPATMLLLGTGLIGLAGMGRKKFSKQNPTV